MTDLFEVAHCLDSFAWLKDCADRAVDVVITDPPYDAVVHANLVSGTAVRNHVAEGKHGNVPRVKLDFDPLSSYDFARDLVRVSKRWAIAFCTVEDFGAYRSAVGAKQWVRGGIWFKPNAMGQITGDRPAAAYEGLSIMHRPERKTWNGRGSYAHWTADTDEFPSEESHFVCNGTRGEDGRHPNQKPLKLCLELVAKFTERGDTVLDPFAGSGRIGEACLLLGRKYVGLDFDPRWVAKSTFRLDAAAAKFGSIPDAECLSLCRLPKSPAPAKSPRPGARPRA